MALRISKRTQLKFAEYATAWSTVNQIVRAFEAEDFESDPTQADIGGARRTTCASFHNRIDPLSDKQQPRLLNVYLDAIASWREMDGVLPKRAIEVVRSLRRDGVPIDDDGHLTGPIPSDGALELGDLRLLVDSSVVEEHLQRM